MQEVLRVRTLAQATSVKLALEAAGIDADVAGLELTGILGNPFSVSIPDGCRPVEGSRGRASVRGRIGPTRLSERLAVAVRTR